MFSTCISVSVESSQTEGVRKAEPEQPSANPRLDNEAPSPASADTGGTRQPTSSVTPSASGVLSAEKAASDSLSQFNPPVGPRLLALGRGANKAAAIQSPVPVNAPLMNNELSRGQPGFSPFEEAAHQSRAFIDRAPPNIPPHAEGLQRMPADRSPLNQHPQFNPGVVDHSQADPNSNGYAASKGSRFAKFFDGKTKEQLPPAAPKAQMPVGFTSPSPNLGPRFDQGGYNPSSNSEEPRTMDDIIAMLANSQVCILGIPDRLSSIVDVFVGSSNCPECYHGKRFVFPAAKLTFQWTPPSNPAPTSSACKSL
jgi:hypothetical protein